MPDSHERRFEERRQINQAGLLAMLEQIDQKHEEAHKRMRASIDHLDQLFEDRLKLLIDKQQAVSSRVTEMALTPVDITKLVLTPRVVASLVATVLVIAGSMWAANGGLRTDVASLRSDVRDILTRMASEQRVSDSNAKLIESNSATINRAIDANSRELKDSLAAVNKRQDLLTLQYNQLNEQLTKLTAQRER